MAGGAGSNTGTPAASNPLGPQPGQGTPAFGGQQQPSSGGFGVFGGGFGGGQQQPNAGSQFNAAQNPGANRSNVPDWVQAPEPGAMASQAFEKLTNPATGETFMAPSGGYSVRQQQPSMPSFATPQQQPEMMMSDMRYRPERQQPFGGQFGQPMQNPFQPQQPSFMQDPEYQGYQTQANDLQRQMNEYMQKAPMYQQMQDLQNKMAPFQQRYQQQQMQQRQMQQPSPFRRGQFQQPAGLQGLMGMLGGRGGMAQRGSYEQYVDSNSEVNSPLAHVRRGPTMSRADFDAREQQMMSRLQPSMSMDMPQRNSFFKNGGKV